MTYKTSNLTKTKTVSQMNYNHPMGGKVVKFLGKKHVTTFWKKGIIMKIEWIDEKGNYACFPKPELGHCLSCSNAPEEFIEITEYKESDLINWPKT